MNEFPPDLRCLRCWGWLFEPRFTAEDADVPDTADYVCLSCGTSYAFQGDPPTLGILKPRMPRPDGEDDD